MYAAADDILAEAGYSWYEISNWAKSSHQVSLHNLSYWREADWWGIGPGAHSHVGGVRWWNVKHPAAYSSRMAQGISPAHAREVLSPDQQKVERVLLGLRLSSGISTELIGADKSARIAEFIGRGFLDGRQALDGRLVLTPTGRLVADYVIRELS
jgi:oxygen-independent coproporphyrinogen-3 oxidase